VSYTAESGRLQILEETAAAVVQLAVALAELGEAYDHLDEHTAELMEDEVFRPLQGVYGQLKRTQSEFGDRYHLPVPSDEAATRPAPEDPRTAFEHAADSIETADQILSELQDSLLPVEVGDRELRAGLSQARTLMTPLPGACDRLIRTIGR
jgi:hypothetical protein